MKKIRVVHILHSFGTGGMEKGVATIVRNASEPFEHIIVCLSQSGETERLLPSGTPVIELHKPPGNSPIFLFKFARKLRSLKPAIVHARNWGGTDGIIAARLAGIRTTIQGEHGWLIDDPEGLNGKRLKMRRLFERWTTEYTSVSEHLERWLYEKVRVKKTVTQIYNGVDTQLFCPGETGLKIRTALHIPKKALVIGIVGRLDPIKNHPTLFQAFNEVKRSCPEVRLLVVGDGPERSRLESLAGNGVIFLGNRLDVANILQALDVFVLPSLNEGISNTILEAMATGLPVVATRVGGNSELVEDGISGTLVPPGDVKAIALTLLQYLKNPDLRSSFGKRSRDRTLRDFSVENMVKGYETVYRRVASLGE